MTVYGQTGTRRLAAILALLALLAPLAPFAGSSGSDCACLGLCVCAHMGARDACPRATADDSPSLERCRSVELETTIGVVFEVTEPFELHAPASLVDRILAEPGRGIARHVPPETPPPRT